ncbi:hypothetical protein Tco_1345194 [Tanacetum coccineum]
METNKSIDRSDTQKNLYNALVESYNTDKDIITSYGDVVTLKRGRDDHDKDEDPSAGSNRGSKRRRSGKDNESSKEPKNKESKSTKIMIKKAADLEDQPHQEFNTGNEDVSPVREALNKDVWHRNPSRPPTPDREWHKTKTVDKVFKATNDRLDWHNPKGKPYPHDLSKPLPLIQNEHGRQVIPLDHFINNDLEYLKEGNSSKKYTTSITKTKAADYSQVKWIEDNVSRIWKCVEDLQLGVESYQKKINLQRPDTYCLNLRRMTPYTMYLDIQGIIYEDEMNRNRLMHTDELHKFSDGTLNHVRTALNDIALGIEMEYLPKRK